MFNLIGIGSLVKVTYVWPNWDVYSSIEGKIEYWEKVLLTVLLLIGVPMIWSVHFNMKNTIFYINKAVMMQSIVCLRFLFVILKIKPSKVRANLIINRPRRWFLTANSLPRFHYIKVLSHCSVYAHKCFVSKSKTKSTMFHSGFGSRKNL